MISKRENYFKTVNYDRKISIEKKIEKGVSLRKIIREDYVHNKRFQSSTNMNAYSSMIIDSHESQPDKKFYISLQNEIYSLADIDSLRIFLNSNIHEEVLKGLVGLRKLLSNPTSPPVDKVIKNGAAAKVLDLLGSMTVNASKETLDYPHGIVLFESLWILTNIASGETHHCSFLIQSGLLEILTKYFPVLKERTNIEQALWLIANVAGDEKQYIRAEMFKLGYFQFLMKILLDENFICIRKTILWATSNLLREGLNFLKVSISSDLQKLVEILCTILEKKHLEISENNYNLKNFTNIFNCPLTNKFLKEDLTESELGYSLNILTILTDKLPDLVIILIKKNSAYNILNLVSFYYKFGQSTSLIVQKFLRVLGNFSCHSDEATSEIVDNGILPLIKEILLNERKSSIKKEVCWILSNISAGLREHTILIFNLEGYLQILFHLGFNDKREVRKEIIWCLANLSSCLTHKDLISMIDNNFICLLSEWMMCEDYKTKAVCLEALENILSFTVNTLQLPSITQKIFREIEDAGIENKLEILQSNKQNVIISEKSEKLLLEFFGEEYNYDKILDNYEYCDVDMLSENNFPNSKPSKTTSKINSNVNSHRPTPSENVEIENLIYDIDHGNNINMMSTEDPYNLNSDISLREIGEDTDNIFSGSKNQELSESESEENFKF